MIDEQINSVRRELANMLQVGVITSDSADNKLYYEVNQRYEHFVALKAIFTGQPGAILANPKEGFSWQSALSELPSLHLIIAAGVLVKGSHSSIDLLLVGNPPASSLKKAIKKVEALEGRELNYTVISYDEFYYRYSIRDKFITGILSGKHAVLFDSDNILKATNSQEAKSV